MPATTRMTALPFKALAELMSSTRLSETTRRLETQSTTRFTRQLLMGRNQFHTAARRSGFGASQRPMLARQNILQGGPRRGFRFSAWRKSTSGSGGQTQAPETLGARLKKLFREYGWAAAGVYLSLSVLDFPFCFMIVRIVGTEIIGKIEHFVVSNVSSVIPESVRLQWRKFWQSVKTAETKELGTDEITEKAEMTTWGVQQAQEKASQEASLATQLALAYAIHKSFIFVRVPVTAAITPRVVQILRSWGWNIGKRTPRQAKSALKQQK